MGQRFISKCIAARVCFEEAITSGGSAINRGYSLPDSCTVPLSNAIDKKFHGRRPAKRAKMVDSPRTDIRWRFMFHTPLFTTSRHGRSQKFSASGTNKNSISSVTLTRSIHLRPARLSLSLSLSAKLNWNEGGDVSMAPLPGGKAIRGDIGGINRVYFRKACVTPDHGTIFYPRVNEPARKTENTVITIGLLRMKWSNSLIGLYRCL